MISSESFFNSRRKSATRTPPFLLKLLDRLAKCCKPLFQRLDISDGRPVAIQKHRPVVFTASAVADQFAAFFRRENRRRGPRPTSRILVELCPGCLRLLEFPFYIVEVLLAAGETSHRHRSRLGSRVEGSVGACGRRRHARVAFGDSKSPRRRVRRWLPVSVPFPPSDVVFRPASHAANNNTGPKMNRITHKPTSRGRCCHDRRRGWFSWRPSSRSFGHAVGHSELPPLLIGR